MDNETHDLFLIDTSPFLNTPCNDNDNEPKKKSKRRVNERKVNKPSRNI